MSEIIPENLMVHKPDKRLLERMVDIPEKVLFKKETPFHDLKIVQTPIGRFLKFDETYQAGFIETDCYKGNLPYINYFLIPYLMNKKIKNILLIGFGSGILVNQFEKLFDLKTFDIVDIEEYVFPLAEKYFDFKCPEAANFYLQDALIYLKTTKRKYDLIIADVAGNVGVDERFCSSEYLDLIKKHLKKGGIFVSNMPSSRDIFNKKNKFALTLIEKYRSKFNNLDLYSGETSNKIFYKAFYDLDEAVLDITNLIMIASDNRYEFKIDDTIQDVLDINIDSYFSDLVKTYD